MTKNPGSSVKSAGRALDLLELLARTRRPMSHTEIARSLAIPKSSLTQLVGTLIERRYLALNPGGRGYGLGPAVTALVRQSVEAFDLAGVARPILERLVAEINESCAINVLRGNESEVVLSANSSMPLLYAMTLGDRAPLYATSGGKALLALLPRERQSAYLTRVKFKRITPNTIRRVSVLQKQLEMIAHGAIAYSHEEFTPGIIGMAVPVLNAAGQPVCAINAAIPAVRFNAAREARIGQALRLASSALGTTLHAMTEGAQSLTG